MVYDQGSIMLSMGSFDEIWSTEVHIDNIYKQCKEAEQLYGKICGSSLEQVRLKAIEATENIMEVHKS